MDDSKKTGNNLNVIENRIGVTCFIFGIMVNSGGAISSFLMKDYRCFIATSLCLILNIILFFKFLRNNQPRLFVNVAMGITGCFLFPFIMFFSEYPEQAILYHFILPISFSLMKSFKPVAVCILINIPIIFYKYNIKFPGAAILICFIYLLVFLYCALVTSIYTSFFKGEFESMKKNMDFFEKLPRNTKEGLFTELGIKEKISNERFYFITIVKIDRFDTFNMEKGVACGKKLLKQVSEILQSLLNSSFLITQVSYDEFLIVSSYSDPEIYSFIEMMKGIIEDDLKKESLTVSIGISDKCKGLSGIDQARERLYIAKKRGGNVIVHSDQEVE